MTPPSRTLGIAFSDGDCTSRVAGAVVRDDFALDGLVYAACSVGGTDATETVRSLVADLGREDVRHVCVAGVAPAWFNLLDLGRLHRAIDRPVYAVSYEASPGLEPALREAFDGDALDKRLATYRALPPRRRVSGIAAEADPLFVRAAGIDTGDAADAVSALVREGFRHPEPVRVASLAASAHRAALTDE